MRKWTVVLLLGVLCAVTVLPSVALAYGGSSPGVFATGKGSYRCPAVSSAVSQYFFERLSLVGKMPVSIGCSLYRAII